MTQLCVDSLLILSRRRVSQSEDNRHHRRNHENYQRLIFQRDEPKPKPTCTEGSSVIAHGKVSAYQEEEKNARRKRWGERKKPKASKNRTRVSKQQRSHLWLLSLPACSSQTLSSLSQSLLALPKHEGSRRKSMSKACA